MFSSISMNGQLQVQSGSNVCFHQILTKLLVVCIFPMAETRDNRRSFDYNVWSIRYCTEYSTKVSVALYVPTTFIILPYSLYCGFTKLLRRYMKARVIQAFDVAFTSLYADGWWAQSRTVEVWIPSLPNRYSVDQLRSCFSAMTLQALINNMRNGRAASDYWRLVPRSACTRKRNMLETQKFSFKFWKISSFVLP